MRNTGNDNSEMPDEELIRLCRGGDSNAFETLLERYYEDIHRIAYRWCQDQHNAEDITQLACIKLASAVQSFRQQSSFSSWLYSLVINTARDYYKSAKHSGRQHQSLHDSGIEQAATLATATQSVFARQVLEHINEMQADLKDALVLVYISGLNHRQAAERLGVKESTVSWRIHEARKLLKQTFDSSSLEHEESRGMA